MAVTIQTRADDDLKIKSDNPFRKPKSDTISAVGSRQ